MAETTVPVWGGPLVALTLVAMVGGCTAALEIGLKDAKPSSAPVAVIRQPATIQGQNTTVKGNPALRFIDTDHGKALRCDQVLKTTQFSTTFTRVDAQDAEGVVVYSAKTMDEALRMFRVCANPGDLQ